jgi:TPR repeat protein
METAWRRAIWLVTSASFALLLPTCAETSALIDCHAARGDPDSCYTQEMARHESVARDEADCERGDAAACVRHGHNVETTDPDEAAEAYRFACARRFATGCTRSGALLAARSSSAADRARALELETRGCTLGDALGCAGAGELQPDRAAGDRLAERACVLGAASCTRAGAARIKDDPKRARELLGTGCKARVWDSCIALGRLEATSQ